MSNRKKFTVAQILDAMEANNVPHARGTWFGASHGEGLVGEACILGQTAINLGVESTSLESALSGLVLHSASHIMTWNDREYLAYTTMVKKARELFSPYLDTEVELTTKFYESKVVKSAPI